MPTPNPKQAAVRDYLRELTKILGTGIAREHSHRPALISLFQRFAPRATVLNDAARVQCGAPDLILLQQGTELGYVETKDVDANLNEVLRSDQLHRYLGGLSNFLLTNYLEFRWYVMGEPQGEPSTLAYITSKGKLEEANVDQVIDLLTSFCEADVPVVRSPKELAERMAGLAKNIRYSIDRVFREEPSGEGSLHQQLRSFREVLIHDLSYEDFADMYSQTICYGLFAARCNVKVGEPFNRDSAARQLPKTNPFLQNLFAHIAGPQLDARVSWGVDALVNLLNKTRINEVMSAFGKRARREDPVVHFYETFLAAYDPEKRKGRGVYYTPEPVVSYIVRSVHGLLKSEFSLKSGLADSERIKIKVLGASGKPEEHEVHRVLVLDPAVGTGTFLHGVIDEIFDELEQSGQRGTWNKYVAQNLLPRVFGFELQMAPYAVCHMKLGLQLEELGYKFRNAERLQVFLTNTLEAKYEYPRAIPFARWLSDEAIASKKVKEELPIMVVIGNPPYSRSSWNRSKFIEDLMLDYKVNVRESESQIQGLSNDYIKFIRFAQWRLDTTKQGILAFITGHGYLNGPQARDMRRSLLASFDSIFILNLHGSLRRDHGLNVQSDEPVFDIQQGTAIIIGVRHANRPKSDCMVSYADLVGTVDSKFSYLGKSSVFDGEWDVLSPRGPNYYFVPERSHQSLEDEYSAYLGLPEFFGTGNRATDKEKYWATGCATQQDHFAVAFSVSELKEKVDALIATKDEDAARRLFKLCSTDQWNYERAKSELAEVNVKKEAARYLYRPFDWRISLLDRNVISIPRFAVMKHLKGDKSSLALICSRVVNDSYFAHVACTRDPVDKIFLSGKTSTNAYVFPLFQTSGEGLFGKKLHSTLSELAVERLTTKLGLAYESAGNKSKGGFDAAQVMSYVYAILYCPTYRERYAEFLKADFPKIPITSDPSLFLEMSRLGSELISLHLLEADLVKEIGNRGFPKAGDDHVQNGFPHYAAPGTPEPTTGKALRNGRVYINSESGRLADGQFFDNVPPEVWDFRVGGYRVCEKWLKDRRGKELASEEIVQYQQIVNALEATIRIMAAIDACIPTWPVR